MKSPLPTRCRSLNLFWLTRTLVRVLSPVWEGALARAGAAACVNPAFWG